jgi:hypothetical protein
MGGLGETGWLPLFQAAGFLNHQGKGLQEAGKKEVAQSSPQTHRPEKSKKARPHHP